jgi:hypothetical protein
MSSSSFPRPKHEIYRATVARAVELCGGEGALSQRLQLPAASIARWLSGIEQPAMGTFLQIIDLVIEEERKPRYQCDPGNSAD